MNDRIAGIYIYIRLLFHFYFIIIINHEIYRYTKTYLNSLKIYIFYL